jgi:C_GCAxxG_C_C family probable redox protein
MATNADDAVAMFAEGYNCAQAVLACCGRAYGLPKETAVQVAQAFGGGIGKTGNLCGALTGALMTVGLKWSAKTCGRPKV